MEIKQIPPNLVIPLEPDELNAVLLAGQFIAALGQVKRNGLDMIRDLNMREPVAVEDANSGICHTGECSTSIALRMVAAAQAAAAELTLANCGDVVN